MAGDPILVLGATGTIGRRLTRQLRAANAEVRAGSRRGEVRFDWTDPETWEPAVAIFLIVKGFRPSPVLDNARYTGGDGSSLHPAAVAP